MYSKKLLSFEFENYSGAFDDAGNTTLKIGNVKASCRVSFMGSVGGYQAEATLYGLSLDLIAALSAKGIGPYTDQAARIGMKIIADGTEIFSGQIFSCFANMNSIPEVPVIISAVAGGDLARTVAKPFSLEGKQAYTDILSAICKANGYNLKAVNADGLYANNISLHGSPLDQIRTACNAADLQFAINGNNVSVWKQGLKIDDVIPLVSPENGLIGYPVFTQSGLTFQSQFSSYLAQGRYVKLITSLPHATGTYQLFATDHYLSSWVKNGPWLTLCQAIKVQDAGQQQ